MDRLQTVILSRGEVTVRAGLSVRIGDRRQAIGHAIIGIAEGAEDVRSVVTRPSASKLQITASATALIARVVTRPIAESSAEVDPSTLWASHRFASDFQRRTPSPVTADTKQQSPPPTTSAINTNGSTYPKSIVVST